MRKSSSNRNSKVGKNNSGKMLPNSLRIISSCIRTVSTNAGTAVRSAAASISNSSSSADDRKEQVLWAGFDKLEFSPTSFRRVLLLGYLKGFQVFDVEDASGLSELVSRRDGPVTFLQMLPAPSNSVGATKYKSSHPLLVVVGGNEDDRVTSGPGRYGSSESSFEPPTAVRFYSLKSNEYVKSIDFKSPVFMVRCSPRVVAIGLEEQVYCFDTVTLENKFVVITYPVPRVGEQGALGINTGYGPMAVGPRWLAYSPNRPFLLNTGRVSPKSLASSGSPSTSPSSGNLMARYAMESSKHLASGLLTLGDMGYKKLSRYYPELLTDGHSSPGWKAGRLAASEPENAGVIVVKDLDCSEVISQFRAHTSPISALCFDPSGTLLVTASVHGNNINIFRIMPAHKCGGTGSSDWSSSYVHLYKLHRGMTSAVIQDICFSHYSQWIAIVSSRGTGHVFVLSPFGGDDGLQTLHSHGQVTSSLVASTTSPWWSNSSFTVNEQYSSPPPPCTLAVATRIKCSDSGLLNSVSNAAASMVGKSWVPSGAVAAMFHNSYSTGSLDVNPPTGSPLEHILVYTSSGFVVQHEILSSMGFEPSESRPEALSAPSQSEELRVKIEPMQWWDVCRRLDNMEREDRISGSIFDGQSELEIDDESEKVFQENAVGQVKKLVNTDRSHWYLSNAEVQIKSCRLPVWQKSKIHFHVMEAPKAECDLDGELEIERASSHEVEIKHKDLLPVFNHFPSARSELTERSIPPGGRYTTASSSSNQVKEKTNEASIMYHSKPSSCSSTESSEGGSSRRMENVLDLDHMGCSDLDQSEQRSRPIKPVTSDNTSGVNFNADNATTRFSLVNEISSLNVDNTDSAAEVSTPSGTEKAVDFVHLFKEGYCGNKTEFHDQRSSSEVLTDDIDNSGSTHEEEKPEDEGWTGGIFDFSEEG